MIDRLTDRFDRFFVTIKTYDTNVNLIFSI